MRTECAHEWTEWRIRTEYPIAWIRDCVHCGARQVDNYFLHHLVTPPEES